MTQLISGKIGKVDRLNPRPRRYLANIGGQLRNAVSKTPGQIRLAIVVIWLLTFLFAAATWVALDRHHQDMQTIGKDSAPSIIAAESIKWNFAGLHDDVMSRFLQAPSATASTDAARNEIRANVTNQLLAAAENITYGDAERVPIRDLMNGMSAYDTAVAQAIALGDRHDGSDLRHIREAESLAHNTIIPAAEALDKANQSAMDQGYSQQQAQAGWSTVWFVATGVILLAALAATQVLLRRRTHRRISPPLIVSAALTLAWTCWIVTALAGETHQLKVAKQDAFDSIGVLWRARADALSAQSHLSLSLLDANAAPAAQQAFGTETSRLATLSNGVTFDQVQSAVNGGGLPPDGFQGFIGDELRNITFEGEQAAANEMLGRFSHYMSVADQVRDARANGQTPQAVELCLGDDINHARGALKSFDDALSQVLQINQHAFDQAVERGFQDVAGFTFWNIGVTMTIAIAANLGLLRRLREYAI